jgi:hypothetical protein
MNRTRIKFKYLMNLWKTLPHYPTKEDVVYELSVYLLKDGRPNGEFTSQTFNSAFGNGWQETKHGSLIETMIKDGDFIEVGVYSGKPKYKLKETPRYSE